MSHARAIGAVTAVLKTLLENEVSAIESTVSDQIKNAWGNNPGLPKVTAWPLDRVVSSSNGADLNQINLFLHRVTPNPGWRNKGLPSFDHDGRRVSNPPLAIDLSYLLTAYGREDASADQEGFHAQIWLGYAMQILHENSVLSRNTIETRAKGASSIFFATGLADQVEQVKISPEPLTTEEISKLWAAFQTPYRPSVAFKATVLLIEREQPIRSVLPVLRRGAEDRGAIVITSPQSPFPVLEEVILPNRLPNVQLGETLTIRGRRLEGEGVAVRFRHRPFDRQTRDRLLDELIEVPSTARTSTEVKFAVPDEPAQWPAGLYGLKVMVRREGETELTTNELPVRLATKITAERMPIDASRENGTAKFSLDCSPEVWPEQHASLFVGDEEVAAKDHPTRTGTLEFEYPNAPDGKYMLRLRVDGVDSLPIDRSASTPRFDEKQMVWIT